jgi:hypothetical protein
MTTRDFPDMAFTLDDGLGTRSIVRDDRLGPVETLVVAHGLASATCEEAIRSRTSRLSGVGLAAPVHRVERVGGELRVTSGSVNGMRLSTMLAQLEMGSLVIPDSGILELVSRVFRAAADLQRALGHLGHGALNPAHVVLTEAGTIVLTDCVYGSALESLEWSRERLWQTFGLALPSAAGFVRFDCRSDVTELGALALALLLRRPLRANDYPRNTAALVSEAAGRFGDIGSPLRTWLQDLLHLHSRAASASAAEAGRALTDLLEAAASRRAGYHVIGILGHRIAARVPSMPALADLSSPAA